MKSSKYLVLLGTLGILLFLFVIGLYIAKVSAAIVGSSYTTNTAPFADGTFSSKIWYANGVYWIFFDNGTMYYTSSSNGSVWNPAVATGIGGPQGGATQGAYQEDVFWNGTNFLFANRLDVIVPLIELPQYTSAIIINKEQLSFSVIDTSAGAKGGLVQDPEIRQFGPGQIYITGNIRPSLESDTFPGWTTYNGVLWNSTGSATDINTFVHNINSPGGIPTTECYNSTDCLSIYSLGGSNAILNITDCRIDLNGCDRLWNSTLESVNNSDWWLRPVIYPNGTALLFYASNNTNGGSLNYRSAYSNGTVSNRQVAINANVNSYCPTGFGTGPCNITIGFDNYTLSTFIFYINRTAIWMIKLNNPGLWAPPTQIVTGLGSNADDLTTMPTSANIGKDNSIQLAFPLAWKDGNNIYSSQFIFANQSINITSPTNSSYNINSVPTSWSVTSNVDNTFWVNVTLDGVYVYNNPTYVNNTIVTNTTSGISDGAHNFVLTSAGTIGSISSTVAFSTDTVKPFVSIASPQLNTNFTFGTNDSKQVNLNYTTSDSNGISQCWYQYDINGTNITIPSCLSTVVPVYSIGNHSVTLYANDTFSNINSSTAYFFIDYLQQWSNTQNINFTGTFKNSTSSYAVDSINSMIILNLSVLPTGSVTATFSAPLYYNAVKTYSITFNNVINDTITFSSAGITFTVRDEDTIDFVKQYKVQVINSTNTLTLTVAKTSLLPFLDDNPNTESGTFNEVVNYTYGMGYDVANFTIAYRIVGSGSVVVSIFDPVNATFSTVFTVSGTDISGTPWFLVNNSENLYGDFPLFRLTTASAKVSEITLASPYSYNRFGQASINFQKFGLLQDRVRFKVTSQFLYPNVFRNFFITPSPTTDTQLTAYLSNFCFYQNFNVLTTGTFTTSNVAGAMITIYKLFNSVSVPIAQETSNAVGAASICVEQGFPYDLVVTASGFNTFIAKGQTFFNNGQPNNVILVPSGSTAFTGPLDQVTSTITPNIYYIANSTPTNYTCFVNAGRSNLNFVAFNITNSTGKTIDFQNISTPTGASITFNLNKTGTYLLKCSYQLNGVDSFNGTVINGGPSITVFLYAFGQGFGGAGIGLVGILSPTSIEIVALFITMMVTGFFAKYFGVKTGFLFLMVYGIIIVASSSWGFNIETGSFIVGILLWLALVLWQMGL